MPIAGRKPKPPDQRRNRMPPRHDWTEVPNVRQPVPNLGRMPRHFKPFGRDKPPLNAWPTATQKWWRNVASMPHTALWMSSEWQFAYDTALIVAAYHSGELRYAMEVRTREKIMGTTADYRRDLRIRYIDPDTGVETDVNTATVTAMADYQRMVDDEG